MTKPEADKHESVAPDEELDLSKETLTDLDAPEDAADDAKGGAGPCSYQNTGCEI
jgi:hypothetical protein